ncbi:MAG: gamma-glutamyltransferase [Pseudomonadota bacterium]|nr:gamma-glutamyltransferase [Pseudomonadota bacterium]
MRQYMTILVILLLYGCSGKYNQGPSGIIRDLSSYFGGVAADEAHASLVGHDILSAGGTSADAAVAMAFALMVSRPDAAGPGGGGVCVHYNSAKNQADSLEFLPRNPNKKTPRGYRTTMIPGSFRGLYALHAHYGKLRWEQLVKPAEKAARFGWPVSKGLKSALNDGGHYALKENDTRKLFTNSMNKFLSTGEIIEQFELAATLSIIRHQGPGYFYAGPLGRAFIKGVKEKGGWLSNESLRMYMASWNKTVKAEAGHNILHFPLVKGLGTNFTYEIWNQLGNQRGFESLSEANKAAIFISAARKSGFLNIKRTGESGGSVGLIAMDVSGNATSCVLTMNRPFGLGYMAGSTGIIEAAPSVESNHLNIAPVIMANKNLSESYLAATAAGDQYAGIALASTLIRLLNGGKLLEEVLLKPRYVPGNKENEIIVEKTLPKEELKTFIQKGLDPSHVLRSIGQVNIVYCEMGIVTGPKSCVVRTDPRTAAYGVNSEH